MAKQSSSERIITRKVAVTVSPLAERRMEIRWTDWERLKRRLTQMSRPLPRLSLWYSTSYGVAITASFTLISFAAWGRELPPWGYPLYGCILFFGVVFGTILLWFDRRIQSGKALDIKDVLEEMEEIETEHKG